MHQGGADADPNPSATSESVDEDHSSRVHFAAQQVDTDHELGIVIRDKGDSLLEIHLGFLKLNHHYTMEFTIKDSLGEDIMADPLQNLHCRVTSCPPSDDGLGHVITVYFHAYKDKLVNESLTLTNMDNTKCLTLKLMARVLGKHKGTPMLKNGIKCVGIDADEESEQSDWAGFT